MWVYENVQTLPTSTRPLLFAHPQDGRHRRRASAPAAAHRGPHVAVDQPVARQGARAARAWRGVAPASRHVCRAPQDASLSLPQAAAVRRSRPRRAPAQRTRVALRARAQAARRLSLLDAAADARPRLRRARPDARARAPARGARRGRRRRQPHAAPLCRRPRAAHAAPSLVCLVRQRRGRVRVRRGLRKAAARGRARATRRSQPQPQRRVGDNDGPRALRAALRARRGAAPTRKRARRVVLHSLCSSNHTL